MGFAKKYFISEPSDPPGLSVYTERRVRFEEVDMLGIVWHGNYVSFLDDGRVAFGDRYPDLSYGRLREEEVAAPIVQLHIDYQSPLGFDEIMRIETTLHWTDALRLNFSYHITKLDGSIAVKAYSVQLFTDLKGSVLLLPPAWIDEFRRRWQSGELS